MIKTLVWKLLPPLSPLTCFIIKFAGDSEFRAKRNGHMQEGLQILAAKLKPLRWRHLEARSVLHFSQLMENRISTIERGAFQDLKELERL